MSYVFMRLKWTTDPISSSIWYGQIDSKEFTKQEIKPGDDFNIKVGTSRYCIGSESGQGKWISCVERQENDGLEAVHALKFVHPDDVDEDVDTSFFLVDSRKFIQCYRCSTTEYFSCRMTCLGDLCDPSSPLAKKLCTPANTSVYLTYVGGEHKVGVSLGIPRRWIEQGSDLAAVVAVLPGLEARRVEQIAGQELNLKLQVRGHTKIKNLNNLNIGQGKKVLEEKIEAIKPIVTKILESTYGELIENPEIQDFSEIYGSYDQKIPVQEVSVEPGIEFGGTIQAIKGSIMIVRQGDFLYAMNLKQLYSYEFEFLDRRAKLTAQSYLDMWF